MPSGRFAGRCPRSAAEGRGGVTKGVAMARNADRLCLGLALLGLAGCTTVDSDRWVTRHGESVITQKGDAVVVCPTSPGGGPTAFTVYYPVPFVKPPNLSLTGDTQAVELLEQTHDHF